MLFSSRGAKHQGVDVFGQKPSGEAALVGPFLGRLSSQAMFLVEEYSYIGV